MTEAELAADLPAIQAPVQWGGGERANGAASLYGRQVCNLTAFNSEKAAADDCALARECIQTWEKKLYVKGPRNQFSIVTATRSISYVYI
jgi:hypothetical protein